MASGPFRKWLRECGLSDEHADEAAAAATAEASQWTSIALVAQVSPPAAQQLRECGLSDEHAALASAALLPLLSEMVSARAVGSQSSVAALRPADDAVLVDARALLERAASPARAHPDPAMTPSVTLLVARYQEDVSWLHQLPARVAFHIVQKGGALQPEFPAERQSLLPNVGRESHSYLSFLAERAHDEAAPLSPLLVCTQADPFPHNPAFLEEVAALADVAASAPDALCVPRLKSWAATDPGPACPPVACQHAAATAAASGRPLFVPLGKWSGGERMIVCDASGAPHQPKLLPLLRTWAALFGSDNCGVEAGSVEASAAPAEAPLPPPLWLSFTPGAIFAVSRRAYQARPAAWYARACDACGLSASEDPIVGHAFERLWWYIFDPGAAVKR